MGGRGCVVDCSRYGKAGAFGSGMTMSSGTTSKITAFWGAAAAIAFASQAHAGGGYVGAAYVDAKADVGSTTVENDGVGLEGAAAFETSPGVGVQLGAVVIDDDSDDRTFSFDGHLNLRDRRHLIGAFASATDDGNDTTWSFGAEGELYQPKFTLAGAVGFSSENDVDMWGLDGEARYFVSQNFRLEGELGYTNFDTPGNGDSAVRFGAGAEYQFARSPFSIHGGFEHTEFDDTDLSVDAFTVGGRFNFDHSLLERDRKGASLPGLSSFTRALGI